MVGWVFVSLGDWEEDGREGIKGKRRHGTVGRRENGKKHSRGWNEEMDGKLGGAMGGKLFG